MVKDSLFIKLVINKEFIGNFKISPYLSFGWNIFIKSWKVRRNTCMKTTDYFIKNCFLFAYVFFIWISSWTSKTILFINHLPNGRTIIVCKRLNIYIKVKILPFIILLVFYMPYPSYWLIFCLSFFLPYIKLFNRLCFHFISFDPVCRNIFFIASTDSATFWFTNFISRVELTLSVEICSKSSEVFSFNKRMKKIMSFTINL